MQGVMAHMWLSHITHMNTYEWVTSLHIVIWLIHIRLKYCYAGRTHHWRQWVMAHMWMSHGTHMNESYHNMKWCDSFTCVHMCAMTHSYVCHDSLISVVCAYCVPKDGGSHHHTPPPHPTTTPETKQIGHVCQYATVQRCACALICVPWLIHMCDMKYGVATTCRLLKIIGLFCKRALLKRLYSARETCNFKERTSRSHPL